MEELFWWVGLCFEDLLGAALGPFRGLSVRRV